MTDVDLLTLLVKRTQSVQLRGQRVDSPVFRDGGPPGLFVPSGGKEKSKIFLRSGRPVPTTSRTLCHELGHFWAYATSRRTAAYDGAIHRYMGWEGTIVSRANNSQAAMRYENASKVPKEVFQKAVEAAVSEMPSPLSEGEKAEIVAEEARAWCLGLKVAVALGISDVGAFCAEVNSALGFYYLRLMAPAVEWTPASCNCSLTDEDERFIADLSGLETTAIVDE